MRILIVEDETLLRKQLAAELEALGVARVSLGPRHMRVLLTLLRTIAQELLTTGTYEHMRVSTISYADVNRWFAKQ